MYILVKLARKILKSKHVKEASNKLKQFHSNEDGAEMAETILIVALISLPIVALLVTARGKILDWFCNKWTTLVEGEEDLEKLDGCGD